LNSEIDDGIPLESPRGLAGLLKSAANPARVQILASLLHGSHEFSQLMQKTKLSKTALANHVNRLMETGLIERVARGEYTLTTDGRELLKAALTVYRNSARREEERRKALLSRYTKGLVEGKTMRRKEINKKVEYQPCWLSYTGAIAGSLKGLGIDCDIVDVGGHSGYAFIINVSRGVTCPSGPTALPPETWKQIHAGTESLGWTMEHYEYPKSYPAEEGNPTPEEIEIAQRLFEKIRHEIDERDRPVVLWGLVAPEYGIVKGYEENSYVVSTFRRLIKQPETPIPFHDLKAPGCIDAFFFRNRVQIDARKADKEALDRALRFATADVLILDNYVAGPEALDEWARVLESVPEEKQIYHGNSYVGVCVAEGRAVSAAFLKRLAAKLDDEQAKHLLEAADCYEKGARLMDEFTGIFPFKFEGEMKLRDRKNGAEILRKVKPLEETAIHHMRKATRAG